METSMVRFEFTLKPHTDNFDIDDIVQEVDYHVTDPLIESTEIIKAEGRTITVSATLHHTVDEDRLQELAADLDYGFVCPKTGIVFDTELTDAYGKPF
ncbi:hypothetical protein [Halomonas sp. KO116]|uniref:hypothetical protein n=1 Tax=Halomonas sp. KO116 TaxID=1504981 RepID=UPI0004E3FC7C|nr:hypothetical protein [Halomonas sp. KO116]AJY53199.1 hypothetical protein KO116_P200092 [Halomonas sp. KO116]